MRLVPSWDRLSTWSSAAKGLDTQTLTYLLSFTVFKEYVFILLYFYFQIQLTAENEELTQHLNASRESQSQQKTEVRSHNITICLLFNEWLCAWSANGRCSVFIWWQLKELQERYSECEDMLHEAREDIKNLRNKSLPNSTVQRYSTLASGVPMDSLAAEIEGTFRKGLDSPAPTEYKLVHLTAAHILPKKVFSILFCFTFKISKDL